MFTGHFDRAAHDRVNALQTEIESTGVLVVHLLRGSRLLARDSGGTSDLPNPSTSLPKASTFHIWQARATRT